MSRKTISYAEETANKIIAAIGGEKALKDVEQLITIFSDDIKGKNQANFYRRVKRWIEKLNKP